MLPPPAPSSESSSEDEEEEDRVYCLCKLPWGGRDMIACKGCDEWFHVDCVGVDLREFGAG